LLGRLGVAIEVRLRVKGVDRADHEVHVIVVLQDGVGKDAKEDGSRVCETRGLDDHPVQCRYRARLFLVQELQKRVHEILARGATHASALEEDRLLLGAP
jgi:hypothetical protein